ncbi:hypothetical protein N9A28_04460 [Sulfurimonas sp.]|nr:hypothetical protein [Sulfurimonas sp.]
MIVKINPKNKYTRLCNDDISNISNNALIVYTRFMQLHPDINPTDKFMTEKCNMSINTYKVAKKELVNEELLYVQRTGGRGANIIYYIGSAVVDKILVKKGRKSFRKV